MVYHEYTQEKEKGERDRTQGEAMGRSSRKGQREKQWKEAMEEAKGREKQTVHVCQQMPNCGAYLADIPVPGLL